MNEQLLNEVGVELQKWIKDRIRNKRFNRMNKIGGTIPPSPRKIYGSGELERSVNVVVEGDELLIYMNDYGADILFGEGRRAQPRYESGQGKIDIVGIPPVNKIRDWMRTVPSFQGLSVKELNGLSFGIAINIAKRGIGALDLFTEQSFENESFELFESIVDRILQKEEYEELGLDIEDVIDSIVLLSNNSMEIIYE